MDADTDTTPSSNMSLTSPIPTDTNQTPNETSPLHHVHPISPDVLIFNEDLAAAIQLIHRLQKCGTDLQPLMQFVSDHNLSPCEWETELGQPVQNGIEKGNALFNIIKKTIPTIQNRRRYKKGSPFHVFSLENLIILDRISTGSVGQVHFGFDITTNNHVAVKVIRKATSGVDRKLSRRLKDEIRIISTMQHPNIVKTIKLMDGLSNVFHIMEYCDGGDLVGYLKAKKRLDEVEAKYIFLQTVDVVKYLHSNGIVHRDLKPENMLLLSNSKSHPKENHMSSKHVTSFALKLSDFGAATYFKSGQLLYDTVGTLSYAAPEVLHACGVHGYIPEAADIWSLGVILFAMLCGCLPWSNENRSIKEAQNHVLANPIDFSETSAHSKCKAYSSRLSLNAKDLLSSILVVEPEGRLTIDQISSHAWLSNGNTAVSMKQVNHVQPVSKKLSAGRARELSPISVQQTQRMLSNQLIWPRNNFSDTGNNAIVYRHGTPNGYKHVQKSVSQLYAPAIVHQEIKNATQNNQQPIERIYSDKYGLNQNISPRVQVLAQNVSPRMHQVPHNVPPITHQTAQKRDSKIHQSSAETSFKFLPFKQEVSPCPSSVNGDTPTTMKTGGDSFANVQAQPQVLPYIIPQNGSQSDVVKTAESSSILPVSSHRAQHMRPSFTQRSLSSRPFTNQEPPRVFQWLQNRSPRVLITPNAVRMGYGGADVENTMQGFMPERNRGPLSRRAITPRYIKPRHHNLIVG